MQRIAQDWLVLSQLTNHSGTSVGIIMALQFGPPILLVSVAGKVVDKCDHRRLLIVTQIGLALTALCLGILVLTDLIVLWHVYLFAGLVGCISAFDSPARQTFVTELVGDKDLSNAVALNSILFNSAQLVGPAVSGILISIIGAGWVFLLNSLSFAAVIVSLVYMRQDELFKAKKQKNISGGFLSSLIYIRNKPELVTTFIMLFILGTYGLNFPVFISTVSITSFHGGAHLYGLLSSMMAIGSISGALFIAGKKIYNINILILSSILFGVIGMITSMITNVVLFGILLGCLGALAQIFTTTTNSYVQLSTLPELRGRVMAIYMGIFLGCTPLGAPVVGWIADKYGPRWSLFFGAFSGCVASLVGYILQKKSIKKSVN